MFEKKNPWYQPSLNSPFGSDYLKEFRVSRDRTFQEVKSLLSIISSLSPSKPRVIDIAGGFGRIGAELIRQNFCGSIVNFDLNPQFTRMIEDAQIKPVVGDMRILSFADNSFDLALIMFTSFGYFDDRRDDARAISEAYRVLSTGGKLVLDIPNYLRIARNFNAERNLQLENGCTMIYNKRIEGDRLIEERTRQSNGLEENLPPIILRMYTLGDIQRLFYQVGFRSIVGFDQELREFSPDNSKRLWVVGTK